MAFVLSSSFLSSAVGGVRVAIRVTPKASRNAVTGLAREADGAAVLKIAVTAVPESGKANAAVIRLLAKQWGVPRTAIAVVAGAGDRRKLLQVEGDPAELAERLGRWAEQLEGEPEPGAARLA